ncbi:MAG: hypothetical protein OXG58_09970 [Gemmatimonadetes bacterium]|nr:hypothetical protein [Gemmatimonadota bacterium]MCY3944244.1 hypothetical protein [Gemmatimonadota bacterium]
MEDLLLAANSLSGEIPKELRDLPELRGLNLSVNSLSGAIRRNLTEGALGGEGLLAGALGFGGDDAGDGGDAGLPGAR